LKISILEHLEDKPDHDPTAADRKRDHIELAFKSQVPHLDSRFSYEPLFSAHPEPGSLTPFDFLGKKIKTPMWVSSMTGGTALARTINRNLATAAAEFGFGMGLGSCRQLLYSNDTFEDFNVRPILGDDVPLFANLGVAQLEVLIDRKETFLIQKMVEKLRADGLIIHINPMQEWLQPEGDRFKRSPLETIETLLEHLDCPLIVKEVGQGFGKESLKKLFELPLSAVDFAAAGGTSFSMLELLRGPHFRKNMFGSLAAIGHSAVEMVDFTNEIIEELGDKRRCGQVIVSGGIQDFLDGFYCIKKLQIPAVYGQASAFLKHAQGDYATLRTFVDAQIQGLELAEAFLKVR
jgi:isopentenyl-diphosphate Delta-isomerase